MFELGVVYRNIHRADTTLAERLGTLGTATVHEAMGRVGLMQPYMRPIYAGAQAAGSAVTSVFPNKTNPKRRLHRRRTGPHRMAPTHTTPPRGAENSGLTGGVP